MGFLDRLLGRPERDQRSAQWGSPGSARHAPQPPAPGPLTDDQAIERYRYLLRTAPPDQIEQAHREAFASLTPQQRQEVLTQLTTDLPPGERPAGDSPDQLARAATRAELRRPGTLEQSFSRGGPGMGSMIAGGLLAGVAGAFIGTAVMDAMVDTGAGDGGLVETGDAGQTEAAGDFGSGDFGGGDFGGGDFGGGDFGGF